MRRALGVILSADETKVELETFTCGHCNSIVRMQPQVSLQKLDMAIRQGKETRDIRRCGGCDSLICPTCHKKPTCTPFERVLDAMERRARLRAM